MLIGVLSDTHSRYSTVGKALEIVRQHNVSTVIHCGDITDAATVRMFAGFDAHFIFGNCDFDKQELLTAMQEIGAQAHGQWGHLEVGNVKIGWTHGDDQRLFRELEDSGHFDFLFYGHSHIAKQHRTGNTLVVNPGALQRARIKSFAILDTVTGELESVTID